VYVKKDNGPHIERFSSFSQYQNICLSHDFAKSPIGKVFPKDCNEPIIGALVDSEEEYNYLLTNIWQFKFARHRSHYNQTLHSGPGQVHRDNQSISHLEIKPLPRSEPLGGTPLVWRQQVDKDIEAIRRAYESLHRGELRQAS